MHRNSNTMLGRKTSTPPTPPMTPSRSKDRSGLSLPAGQKLAMPAASQPMPVSMNDISGAPRVNVRWNAPNMSAMKMGTPQTGCRAQRSMRSVRSRPAAARPLTAVRQSWLMNS